MLVRLQPPELRLGRQSADHPCLNQGMLWVQVPPGPLQLVLVEEPGVLATLSRWRSWVQIPSGTLDRTVRKPAKRPSSNLGDCVWVRFPPVLNGNMRRLGIGEPKWLTHPHNAVQVRLLPDALDGWFVYRLEDASLSRWRDRFDSHTSYMAKWWNRKTRGAQNVVPHRRGSSTLPLVTAEWTGVWIPARSHKPFDAGS